MLLRFLVVPLFLFSTLLYAQENEPISDLDALKLRVKELEEIQNENAEILKRQLADQHYDQNSRGYLEIKGGFSTLNPDDIEDENDEEFDDADDATWGNFDYGKIFEIEIGKTIMSHENLKHEIGIGYQLLKSKTLSASYTATGGDKISVEEDITFHTIYARYALLFKGSQNGRFYVGPGMTLGYSPVSKIVYQLDNDDSGTKITGESTSFLIELFGKMKLQFSRYVSLVYLAGYRLQEADDLRISNTELDTVKTKTDLDASGFFTTIGFGFDF